MGSARLQQIKLDQQLLARPSLAQTGSARCLVNNKQNSNRCSVQYTKPSNPWILTYVSKVKAKCTICNEDWLTTLGFLFLCFAMMLYPFSDHVEWSEVLVVQEIRFIPTQSWVGAAQQKQKSCLPYRTVYCLLTFGPSGVCALPLAAGRNEGSHYFR